MSEMQQTYLETLQTLFHTLKLYGYEFEKTTLLTKRAMLRFKKEIDYVDDDENSDFYGEILKYYICVNVEFDISENVKGEKPQQIINELLEQPDLPNVNVPRYTSEYDYDDEYDTNPKEELKFLFQTLDLHGYQHIATFKEEYENDAEIVFQCSMFKKIFVKIEISANEIMEQEDLENEDPDEDKKMREIVDRLLNAPAARGKRKNQNTKKTKRSQTRKSKKSKKMKRSQTRKPKKTKRK